MSDSSEVVDSWSGRNAHMLHCKPAEQSMHYAACQHRLKAIDDGTAPSDWNSCARSRSWGQCQAAKMQAEERSAGKTLFFLARDIVRTATAWVMPSRDKKAASRKDASSALDSTGDAGSYSDAISAAASEPTKPAAVIPIEAVAAAPVAPAAVAIAGETPLQMARRLAAERKAKKA